MKNVRELTKDSFFATIIVAINLLFNFNLYFISEIVSLLSISLIAGYFYNKNKKRLTLTMLALIVVSFFFHDFFTYLRHVLPTILLGVLAILTLKVGLSFIYNIILTIVVLVFEILGTIVEFYFLFDLNIVKFTDEIINEIGFLAKHINNTSTIWIIFLSMLLLISFMKVIIIKNIFIFYNIRIRPLIEEVN